MHEATVAKLQKVSEQLAQYHRMTEQLMEDFKKLQDKAAAIELEMDFRYCFPDKL